MNEVRRALAVSAHPDDIDFGAAGTLAQWVAEGWQVTELFCTRGEQGGFDPEQHAQMPQIREREQRAAAAVIGIEDVRFLDGYRDGWLEPTWDLQRHLVRVIREVRPQRMIIPSAQRWYQRIPASHPDHLAAGEAAIRAIYPAAENHFAFPELLQEGLEPVAVPEIWVMSHQFPDHVVDITDQFDQKVAVLRSHVSQTGHRGEELPGFLRGWAAEIGREHGLAEGRLGEAFLRILR